MQYSTSCRLIWISFQYSGEGEWVACHSDALCYVIAFWIRAKVLYLRDVHDWRMYIMTWAFLLFGQCALRTLPSSHSSGLEGKTTALFLLAKEWAKLARGRDRFVAPRRMADRICRQKPPCCWVIWALNDLESKLQDQLNTGHWMVIEQNARWRLVE